MLSNRLYFYLIYSFSKQKISSKLLPPLKNVDITRVKDKILKPYYGSVPKDINGISFFLGPLDQRDKFFLNEKSVILDGYPMCYKIDINNGLLYFSSNLIASKEYEIVNKYINNFVNIKVGGYGSIKNGFIGPPGTSISIFNDRFFTSGDFGPIAEFDPFELKHLTYVGSPSNYKYDDLEYKPTILTGLVLKSSDCHSDYNNKEYFYIHNRLFTTDIYLSLFDKDNNITTKKIIGYDKDIIGYHRFNNILDTLKNNTAHEMWSTKNHIIVLYGMYSYDLINDTLPFTERNVIFTNFFMIIKKSDFYKNNTDTVECKALVILDKIKPLHFVPEYYDYDEITLYVIDNGSIDISAGYSFSDMTIFDKRYDTDMLGHTPFDSCMKNGGVNKIIISLSDYKIIESQYLQHPQFTASFFYTLNNRNDNSLNEIFIMSSGSDPEMINKKTYELFKDVDNLPDIESYKNKPVIPVSLFTFNVSSFKFTSFYNFPIGTISFNPQFVKPNYVICLVKVFPNFTDVSNEIWIFNSKNINQGPICKIKDPSINLTNFMTHSAVSYGLVPRQTNYNIPYKEWINLDNVNFFTKKIIEDFINK